MAINYYNKASERANSAGYEDLETQCRLKAADLMVLTPEDKFVEAIKEYEEVAARYMKVPTLISMAKGVIFKALLLYLAIDVSGG